MCKNTSSVAVISLSLLFAGLILLTSYILKGTDYGQTATHLLIAVWFALSCIQNRKRCSSKKTVDINAVS